MEERVRMMNVNERKALRRALGQLGMNVAKFDTLKDARDAWMQTPVYDSVRTNDDILRAEMLYALLEVLKEGKRNCRACNGTGATGWFGHCQQCGGSGVVLVGADLIAYRNARRELDSMYEGVR